MDARKTAFAVHVPAAGEDHPSWAKVGIIAVVGFVVGIGWPRLVGFRLGPGAPADATPATASARVAGAIPSAAAPAAATLGSAPSAPAGQGGPVAAPATAAPVEVGIGHLGIVSCHSDPSDGVKAAGCGALPGFDALARPRLRKLGSCPPAASANGKLSVVFSLDFKRNSVGIEVGRSSTVSSPEAFAQCLKDAMQGVSLGAINHDQTRYAVAYGVTFKPASGQPAAAGATDSSPVPSQAPAARDDASAQVVWEVALVRDKPRTGEVVARLPRGSTVRLGSGDEGWYRVHYGNDFGSEGWLYRGAIGR